MVTPNPMPTIRLKDEKGRFDLPEEYADARQFVVRTPAGTCVFNPAPEIDFFWWQPGGYAPNSHLQPDKVSLKVYGEDAEMYRVENPEIVEQWGDDDE